MCLREYNVGPSARTFTSHPSVPVLQRTYRRGRDEAGLRVAGAVGVGTGVESRSHSYSSVVVCSPSKTHT